MADKTRISWSDATWNPVKGCTKVSEGCIHCFIDRSGALTFTGPNGPNAIGARTEIELRPGLLDQPLRWTRPRKVFVNSQSDLFHDEIPDSFIAQVFAVMALAPQHTFQLLTKRPARMRALVSSQPFRWQVWDEMRARHRTAIASTPGPRPLPGMPVSLNWPLRNVWLGVTVENQKAADLRIPILEATPAAVRYLSIEPMIGPVDLTPCNCRAGSVSGCARHGFGTLTDVQLNSRGLHFPAIDWVIIGGESGRDARPMSPDWVRSLRDQCDRHGVAVWFKQWGDGSMWVDRHNDIWAYGADGLIYTPETAPFSREHVEKKWGPLKPVNNRAAGHLLDGQILQQFPETDLR